ncbi:hypothetical protein I3J09_30950 (plasmid) [Streptomyces clavuligerus]|uniref:Uncharacterized protein n=1 Tax=Streptomyces clavuligerus TaxID=1901 RepID=B5GMM5_STRCL|nr:hypothetical protein [Streptomyces clavuligerus]ANW22680.1 hypothetical protein BB341_29325 [Streptomyces clavuligerus]AXU17550.1 hypothetical protein D1794_32450 [Streptomyces clavuligerus]EDY47571.1 conserved hypothetical protein [Streptomyces clavuligerus]EFG04531.1 Hypothetical protein SCLAV_p1045 [Streptomyces clavuligerus]MBY6307020.1 hypothetical protein [Streptomyces clavuligerus]
MNPFAVLAAFAADWNRLAPVLDPAARRSLRGRLTELRSLIANGAAVSDRESAAGRAVDGVLGSLPADEAARLRHEGGTARFAGASAATLEPGFQGYSAIDLCLLVLDDNPMVGPDLGPIRDRLLAEPSTPWHLAADPRLIVLSDRNGRKSLPLFQFEAGAMPRQPRQTWRPWRPWRIVLEVNTLLGADRDPWGAADWWLSRTTWWEGTPAALLGGGRDTELRGAAEALVAPDGE